MVCSVQLYWYFIFIKQTQTNIHIFFYKKLSSWNEYSVSYENGLFRVLSFFAVSYPGAICAIFVQKIWSFSEKSLDSFLCTWNMSTRFLNCEKIWVLVSYKAVSYKKNVYLLPYFHLCGIITLHLPLITLY